MSESFITAKTSETQETPDDNHEGQLVSIEESPEISSEIIRELAFTGSELGEIYELQRGVERSIIDSGLQVMADRFGADALLAAMRDSFNMREVVDKLASTKKERKELLEVIQDVPIEEVADKFNDDLGGIATIAESNDSLARHRKFGISKIERNKDTDEARELLSPILGKLLVEYPDIADQFAQTNDTFLLLKNIRGVYEEKYGKLIAGIEDAKSAVEDKIAESEAEIAEVQEVSDDIYSSEIAGLEEKLAGVSGEAARKLIEGMLDKKAAEILVAREDLKTQFTNTRQEIITKLHAAYLYSAGPIAPVQTYPSYTYDAAA